MEEEEKIKVAESNRKLLKKEQRQENFIRCKDICICSQDICLANGLKQCTSCKDIIKSQCSKRKCKVLGVKPVMLNASSNKKGKSIKKRLAL